MLVSVASVAVNFGASYALLHWAGMGHAGLALSIALVALFSAAALFELLRRRIGGLHTRQLAASAARILAATAAMSAACAAAQRVTGWPHAANLALCIPLGAAVFYAAARVLRVTELEAVRTACYTFFRNAPRPEVGHPSARN
jgi:peptidoglycan biosynthesis protein MviN/MurJ (putative lipid II flippase)